MTHMGCGWLHRQTNTCTWTLHAHGLALATFYIQCYAPVVVLMYELLRVVEPVHCYGCVAPSAVVIDIWHCRHMCNGIPHV
jgi:hypothetical protein